LSPRGDGVRYVRLVVKKRYDVREEYDGVLTIDVGAWWTATSVVLSPRETTFNGEDRMRPVAGIDVDENWVSASS
jgi:hypothetical protein